MYNWKNGAFTIEENSSFRADVRVILIRLNLKFLKLGRMPGFCFQLLLHEGSYARC